jgi:hypothetical protein
MELIERARRLQALGLLPAGADLNTLVSQADPQLTATAPATALFIAAGVVLEIAPNEHVEEADIAPVMMRFQKFCGNLFTLSDIEPVSLGVAEGDDEEIVAGEAPGDEPITPPNLILLKFKLNGYQQEIELLQFTDEIEQGYFEIFDDFLLNELEHDKTICPLLEVMDGTARYLFANPEAFEQAEIDELITADEMFDIEEDF